MKSKFLNEFKTFIAKGNAIDLAIGVIMGSAFSAITNSLVNDILMPCISALFGGSDYSGLKVVLREATETSEAIVLNYGMLINAIFNFLIIALFLFLVVKVLNKMRAKKEEPAPAPAAPVKSNQEILLEEIRDLLKKN